MLTITLNYVETHTNVAGNDVSRLTDDILSILLSPSQC